MALANRIEWDEKIPHEPEHWFRFRRLSAKQLQKARDLKQAAAIRGVVETPGFLDAIQAARSDTAQAEPALRDPLDSYDRWALLEFGVVAWSYEDGQPTVDLIAELDEDTLDWAARQLIPKPLEGDARLSMFRPVSSLS